MRQFIDDEVTIKRLYRPSYNLMVTGNKCLWFNPRCKDDLQQLRDMEHKRNKRMHIFISHVDMVNDDLKQFITEFFYNPDDCPVLAIHIPGSMPDLKVVIQDMVDHLELIDFKPKPRIRIICDHKAVGFGIPGWAGTPLKVTFNRDILKVSIDITDREIGGYNYKFRGFGGEPGAVKNNVQSKWPELFKDQILAAFKETCPANIMHAFKTDDDIWEFILQEGEWSTREGINVLYNLA